MQLKIILLSEISQTQKDKYHVIFFSFMDPRLYIDTKSHGYEKETKGREDSPEEVNWRTNRRERRVNMVKAHDILERKRLTHNEYIPIKRVHAVYNPLFILLKIQVFA